jgi:hypothetical protein
MYAAIACCYVQVCCYMLKARVRALKARMRRMHATVLWRAWWVRCVVPLKGRRGRMQRACFQRELLGCDVRVLIARCQRELLARSAAAAGP